MRRELLEEQSQFYTPTAPNVLWTLTNVADDALQNGRLGEAQTLYETAIVNAESHVRYSRAKTRFAALEGLAKVAIHRITRIDKRMGGQDTGAKDGSHTELIKARDELLDKADYLLGQAYEEAQVFGVRNRRALRVKTQRDCLPLINMLAADTQLELYKDAI